MKLLSAMTTILLAFLIGCNKTVNDQNFQDHQDPQREPAHYNRNIDPNINSLSNQSTREGL